MSLDNESCRATPCCSSNSRASSIKSVPAESQGASVAFTFIVQKPSDRHSAQRKYCQARQPEPRGLWRTLAHGKGPADPPAGSRGEVALPTAHCRTGRTLKSIDTPGRSLEQVEYLPGSSYHNQGPVVCSWRGGRSGASAACQWHGGGISMQAAKNWTKVFLEFCVTRNMRGYEPWCIFLATTISTLLSFS